MELCSLYNRLGQLIRKRALIEQMLRSFAGSEDRTIIEKKMGFEKQLKDVTASITNLNREIEDRENR